MAVCLILLLHALYAGILYLMGIRQKALIYFCLLIVCAIVSILIDDNCLLIVWLPVDYAMTMKIYYLVYVGIAAFIFHYTNHLLPESMKIRWVKPFSAVCAVYALLVPLLPVGWLTLADPFHTLLVLVPFLVVPVKAFRAAIRGHGDILFILLGVTAITANVIWGAVKNLAMPEISYFYPMDMVAAFIAFAAYWFKSYLRSSAQTKRLAEELMEANKRKDQFLVNTSHELRNPLHGMLNIAQSMLAGDSGHDEAKTKENMRLLVSVGKRMSFLLNDLLDITRLKENRIRLQVTAVRVQALASGVLDMIHFMTEGKPIKLVNRIPAAFPPVMADENRLLQILFNLLHNAVKFTNEGSITIEAHIRDGQAHIVIADTGIGMDEATQQTIFEPYEQGDTEYAAGAGGIGLGLSISKQLVELHQGTLSVSSMPDRGSVFTVALPLADASLQVPAAEGMAPTAAVLLETAAALSGAVPNPKPEGALPEDCPRILAIDDDPVNLSVLESVLSAESYEIAKATSGKEALALLAARAWDLIIADVMMPHMSGYQLSRAVRERFAVSELPILLLTARSRPEDIEAGFLAGANDYVTKPVDATELKSRVRALTDHTRSVRERLRMEAAWLQAQIQPHFLFNTLNSIAALSELDMARMRALLEMFGNYLRASFNIRNLERFVPLRYELDLVRSYLYIEKERFEDRLQVVWEVDGRTASLWIPPLSIQPLVENAVRHGALKRPRGGTVRIRVSDGPDEAEILVEDDGVGMDEHKLRLMLDGQADPASGMGLRNTDRRLRQLYGHGLSIHSVPGQGTTVSFKVSKGAGEPPRP